MDELFAGTKMVWRAPCDALIAKVAKFGADIEASANSTYVNLLRRKKKFGIIQPASVVRLDIGIKLKGQPASGRFEPAGDWNAMVTHRVRVPSPEKINVELFDWLKRAYDAA
jgi:hypothetical protein